ncbi:MAG: membrane fusion protein of tripartite multidrug resistance system, partial [Methylococcales bacterium]|nr:membrane fusion protein of tripartite multidrug resistance system [Methylococcales bacterium]
NPLRPGLSATVHIDTRLAGQSVLQPLTPMTTYQTDVYDNQLKGADALIHKIIEKNRRAKK